MALTAGTRFGPYEIVSAIAAGGMGEVYRARDIRLRREVAVKIAAGSSATDALGMARFQREGRAIAALNHPNICSVYDVGEHDGRAFLVMEYLEGETVAARVCRGSFSIAETIEIGSQVAEALAAVHRSNLVHRDLKPTNIMLTATGAKLLDFGLAKICQEAWSLQDLGAGTTCTDLSVAGMLLGTLAYMSPEQLQGTTVDHRSDVFALGAVLYEMVTAQRAFKGTGQADIIAAVLRTDPQALKSLRPDAPASLAAVIKACLHKEPDHRWQHAADVAMALRTVIREPVRRTVTEGRGQRQQSSSIRSLVVLPFANAAQDTSQQYLADGMTESLTGSMSVIARLKVISRASAMRYQGSSKPLPQIAKELAVDGAICGSVRLSEHGFEVRVALFEAASGERIWDESYERPMTDLFRVQGEIAETIAAEIHLKLTASERRQFSAPRARLPEVHKAYLRGRYYWNRETPEALQRSFHHLSTAVQRDPDYAACHSALADWYLSAGSNGLIPVAEGIAKAKAAALRALELDERLAEAYASLGRIAMDEWDLQRARAEFETASRLNPNLVEPVIWSARALSYLSLHGEAFKRAELAQELDPVSPRVYFGAAAIYYIAGDCERAIEESRKALEFEPRLAPAFYFMGLSQLRLGLAGDALKSLEAAVEAGQRHAASLAGLAFVLAQTGRSDEVRRVLDEMKDRATRAEVSPYFFAEVYLALGDVDKAISYLRRSYDLRIPDMIGIGVDPLFNSLHGHPEFERILHDLGVPSGWKSRTG